MSPYRKPLTQLTNRPLCLDSNEHVSHDIENDLKDLKMCMLGKHDRLHLFYRRLSSEVSFQDHLGFLSLITQVNYH